MATNLCVKLYWDGGTGAKLFKVTGDPPATTYTEITLPGGLNITGRRPCFMEYIDGYLLITNFWKEVLVVYDNGAGTTTCWVAGLNAPSSAGVTVTAGGAGSLTAAVVDAYLTVAHETASGQKLAESNPTANLIAATLNIVNGTVVFGGMGGIADARANKLYGYLGVEGGIARRVFNVAIGTASVTVNLSVAAIEELTALPNNGISIRTQARTPPRTTSRYLYLYHRRAWYGRDDTYPYRVWYSEIDEPESVDPDSYFEDEGKQSIQGLGEQGGALQVMCRRAQNSLTGWSSGRDGAPADMSFRRVHPSIGTINHHSLVNINGKLFYEAEDGLRIWDGSTRLLGKKARGAERFAAHSSQFYQGIALNDSREQCYIYLLFGGSKTQKYVYYYQPGDPDVGGAEQQLPWGLDVRDRLDTVTFSWRNSDGTIIQGSGSSDGRSFVENVLTDVDDLGDSYAKNWVIIPRHDFCDIPGGGLDTEGKRFDRVWLYMNAQTGLVGVNIWAGDERSYEAAYGPNRADVLTDPLMTRVDATYTYDSMAKAVWEYKPDVSGRGITVGISVPSPPVDSVWYGYTVWWTPGSSARLSGSRSAL